jgi:regulatory protein spx
MPQKQATYMTYGNDERCEEIRKYIENSGYRLNVRDLSKQPLSVDELDYLFGHNPLFYFVNPASSEYSRLGLGDEMPERRQMLELIAQNPGLLRRPIVKSARLITVGCNKEKIAEMLQINSNGEAPEETNERRPAPRVPRRSLPARKQRD